MGTISMERATACVCEREKTRQMAFNNAGNEEDKKVVRYPLDMLYTCFKDMQSITKAYSNYIVRKTVCRSVKLIL